MWFANDFAYSLCRLLTVYNILWCTKIFNFDEVHCVFSCCCLNLCHFLICLVSLLFLTLKFSLPLVSFWMMLVLLTCLIYLPLATFPLPFPALVHWYIIIAPCSLPKQLFSILPGALCQLPNPSQPLHPLRHCLLCHPGQLQRCFNAFVWCVGACILCFRTSLQAAYGRFKDLWKDRKNRDVQMLLRAPSHQSIMDVSD